MGTMPMIFEFRVILEVDWQMDHNSMPSDFELKIALSITFPGGFQPTITSYSMSQWVILGKWFACTWEAFAGDSDNKSQDMRA